MGRRAVTSSVRPIRVRIPRWTGLIALLALWEGAARLPGAVFLLAGPVDLTWWIATNAGLVARAAGVTLAAAAQGFVWGNLAAVVLAIAAFLLPRAAGLLGSLALVVFCLPMVATGPILRVLFGPGTGPQVTLAALAVFYTTYLALGTGLRAAPAAWFDLVRSYGRGRATELLRVRARAALPYLVAGLQIAAPAAFLGAMVGEFTGAERGMGVLTLRAMRALDVAATWGLATIAAAIPVGAYLGLGALGRWLSVAPPAVLLAAPQAIQPMPGLRRIAGAALAVPVVLVLWQGLMDAFALNAFFAKRPGDVWAFLTAGPQAAGNRAVLARAWTQTMVLTLPGYLAGLVTGAGLAAAMALRPGLAATMLPLAIALRAVPIITTAPLIVLALGRGATGTIAVVAVMTFFPTLVACAAGLRQMPGQVADVFATYAATPLGRLRHAQAPAMLPAFFAAARMAVPAAILAATTTEWLATGIGTGTLMALSASTSDYGMLWAAVAALALTAALGYAAVAALERRVLARYAPEQLTQV